MCRRRWRGAGGGGGELNLGQLGPTGFGHPGPPLVADWLRREDYLRVLLRIMRTPGMEA
jgi:hypothetical protein